MAAPPVRPPSTRADLETYAVAGVLDCIEDGMPKHREEFFQIFHRSLAGDDLTPLWRELVCAVATILDEEPDPNAEW